jgi:hypothetical protein
MYGRHKITYIDTLPPLDELENQASRNKDLIEHYQPTTNSTPMRITNSPYASSATMYGGDPNLKQNPQPVFLPKVNVQEELQEKDKLYQKASQKVPTRIDGGTLAMPAKLGPNSLEREYEDYGIDLKQIKDGHEPKISYSESQYVIPDESYIIYEESGNNKRMNHPPPPKKPSRRPPQKQQTPQPQPQRPMWNNQIPSYTPPHLQQPLPPIPPQHRPPPPPHHPSHQQFYPHYSPPPPIPQYYNGHNLNLNPNQNPFYNQQPHICSLISTHLTECPLCMRLYVARKQFSYKDEDSNKARNISSAIYMIIIIFLIICCIFMFKRTMNKSAE